MAGVSHLKKAEKRLKTCEDYTFCTASFGQIFLCEGRGVESQCVFFINFLTEQRTINENYYFKLLKDRSKPGFVSERRGLSVKSVCLLHDNARRHTAAVTTRTLREMYWELLQHPAYSPDLVPRDFHLFSPVRKAIERKCSEPTMKLFVQRWLDEQLQTFF
jgi:hypothetical protein